jgi:DNA-directed RNA polymerase subunit K/omega
MAQNADRSESRGTALEAGSASLPSPITSRFLFVDVAAQRAKQLRRGALPRLDRHTPHVPHKLERIAMDEVRSGLIEYELPTRIDPAARS